jgi:hypothetical protein
VCMQARHDYSHQFLIQRHAPSSSVCVVRLAIATCVILSNHGDVYIGDKPMGWFTRRNHGRSCIRPAELAEACSACDRSIEPATYHSCPAMATMMAACPCGWLMCDGSVEWCRRRISTQSCLFVRNSTRRVPFHRKSNPRPRPLVFYKCAKCESCMHGHKKVKRAAWAALILTLFLRSRV